MVKVHKLVAAIATTITLSTTSAFALNMGEISWKSSYGQPLKARIELSDAKGLQASDIRPSIASANDFAKVGLDRPAELSNLTFNTFIKPDGTGYIDITSTKGIKEPYLNFLVDIDWAGGKITREYTVLLDIATPTNTAATAPASKPVTSSKKPTAVTTATAPAAPQSSGETYRTTRGDTLWSVAQNLYGQTLAAKAAKAIYDKNPKAFINGSANHLLADYPLKKPTEQEVRAVSVAQATALLQSKQAPTPTASTTPTKPAADTKQTQALQNQLQSSEKELMTARRENDELSTKLEQLQAEIKQLEELSQQKDSQIANVGNKLGQETTNNQTTPTDNTTAQQTPEQLAAAEVAKQAEAERVAAEKAKAEEAARQAAAAEAAQKAEAERVAAEKAKAEEAARQAAAAEAAKKQAAQPPQQDTSPSFLEDNLLLIAAGGIVVILALVAVILRRRKAGDDATVVDLSDVTLDDDLDQDDVNPAISAKTEEKVAANSPLSQLGEGMGTIDKADIYLAYNHYDEAKELLINALQDDPTNTEYRLKLMEVYAEQGDRDNFEAEEQELTLLDPLAQHKIDSLRAKYPAFASNQFSFGSSQPAVEEPTPFDSLVTPVTNEPTFTETPKQEEPVADVNFDFGSPSVTTDEPAPVIDESKLDDITPEEERETIYTPDTTRDTDESFELEKVTPDSDDTVTPLFNSNLDENDFASDSAAFDFVKEEEPQPEEEPAKEDFKFDLGFADEPAPTPQPTVSTEDMDDIVEKDQVTTKLELVNAYIDMGDTEGAHDLLEEIIKEGNDHQKAEAQALLASLGGQITPVESSDYSLDFSTHPTETVTTDSEPTISLVDSIDHSNTALTELDLGFELPPEDEVSTKLELANAYIEMGDKSGAKDILEEVLSEGTEEQKHQAQELLHSIS